MQQSAEAERAKWVEEWAVGRDLEQPTWPDFNGLPPPPPLVMEQFSRALLTFPVGTGLGWDALHPRALTRLPVGILEAVMQLLMLCEAAGRWPSVVQLVIIVFLAKADGGFRPIGLIPALCSHLDAIETQHRKVVGSQSGTAVPLCWGGQGCYSCCLEAGCQSRIRWGTGGWLRTGTFGPCEGF